MKKVTISNQNVDYRFNKWFSSRGLKVLDYQKEILLKTLPCSIKNSKLPTVLAASPAAGKTLMSIYFIEQYIKQNPNAKVLVLTHGTTVLRTQYHEELVKLDISFDFCAIEKSSEIKKCKASVIIALPQTLNRMDVLPQFDLLIVDEAHHYYFADMVKRLLKRINPKHQLLLTGTPSEFIAREYPLISVSVNSLIDYGMVDDLMVRVVGSAYNFEHKDYNDNNELKSSISIKAVQTHDTLQELFNKRNVNQMGKTMIACQNTRQAMQINEYLMKQSLNTALSTHDTDKDSNEIGRFKTDNQCKILIVVYRGILGLNLPELETVVDLTISQNINRIFQLLARVLRRHPDIRDKCFIKVAPHGLHEYFKYIMTAVMCLTDEYYYTRYNGVNFMEMKIPVKTIFNRRDIKGRQFKGKNKFRYIEYEGVPALRFFKERLKSKSKTISFAKLRTIKSLLSSGRHAYGYWNLETCKADASKYKTKSEWQRKSYSAYSIAHRKGWIQECTNHMLTNNWTIERCLVIAKNCTSVSEWINKDVNSYNAARTHGWIQACNAHMIPKIKPANYWNYESCKEDALKYNTKTEWHIGNPSAYNTSLKNVWYKELTAHMKKHYWDYESCKLDALRFRTRKEWESSSSYNYALRHKLVNELSTHMVILRKKWTKTECIEIARNCKSKIDFLRLNCAAYNAAYKKGWLPACKEVFIRDSV